MEWRGENSCVKVFGLLDGPCSLRRPWCAVYALVDPRNGLRRYVGVTSDVVNRMHLHVQMVKDGTSARDIWIQGLLATGVIPAMEVLELVRREYRLARETHWIRALNAGGHLTNVRKTGRSRNAV